MHFISIDQLNLTKIESLLDRSLYYLDRPCSNELSSRTLFNLFFEKSTRTINSFTLAGMQIGANVINVNMDNSSVSKGESDFDTVSNIDAMGADFIVIRHCANMFHHALSSQFNLQSSIINAGDGTNEHPTQALGDLLCMIKNASALSKDLKDMKIVIYGDLARSRVAHSHIKLYEILGFRNVHLVAPPQLQVQYYELYNWLNLSSCLKTAIKNADIIMSMRIKNEYAMQGSASIEDFKNFYCLDHKMLESANKNVIVMHPGPVNRGVEICSKLVDDLRYSKILEQVKSCVAMRKAILMNCT